nr:unnamed protein product [Callosobruchus chinensis]
MTPLYLRNWLSLNRSKVTKISTTHSTKLIFFPFSLWSLFVVIKNFFIEPYILFLNILFLFTQVT